MKTKTFLIAALLAGAGFASAQTFRTNSVVYLAGSQAFSKLDNLAISNYAAERGYQLVASTGSTNAVNAKALLYRKQVTNNGIVTVDLINVHQTGSEAGVQSLAGNGRQTVPFLPNNANTLGLPDASSSYSNPQQAHIATSPVWQKSSRFAKGARVGTVTYKELVEVAPASGVPGIAAQTWAWSASSNFPVDAANITSQVARALFKDGHVPLSFFTGNSADVTNGVWLIGRDIAAGARIAPLQESGYGSLNPVRQFEVTTNGGQVALRLEPAESVLGINQPVGNSGYNGTTPQLNATKTAIPANLRVDINGSGNFVPSPYTGTNYLIQYNGFAQSSSAGVVTLKWNGVTPGTNGVASGAYSLWTYEHLYRQPFTPAQLRAPLGSNVVAISQAVATYINNLTSAQIASQAGVGYLNTSDLIVKRDSDGGVITKKQ